MRFVFMYILYYANVSNVAAGKLFGIPLRGTHSHAFVSSFMVSSLHQNKKKNQFFFEK